MNKFKITAIISLVLLVSLFNVAITGSLNTPDVAVTNVTHPAYGYPGWKMNVSVIVSYTGTQNVTTDVNAYYNYTYLIGTQPVTLSPSTEQTLNFQWDTTGNAYCFNYAINGSASVVSGETNTGNNVLMGGYIYLRIPGDVDGNYVVNDLDNSLLGSVYGSTCSKDTCSAGHSCWEDFSTCTISGNWKPQADFNQDGIVNIFDLSLLGMNYEKNCSCIPTTEDCDNEKDDDCDGLTDANDPDCICVKITVLWESNSSPAVGFDVTIIEAVYEAGTTDNNGIVIIPCGILKPETNYTAFALSSDHEHGGTSDPFTTNSEGKAEVTVYVN